METALVVLLWILVVVLIVVGVLGNVIPVLPGAVFVFAGIALGAWIDDFARVSGTVVIVAAVLMGLSWLVDYLSGVLGARRVGASREAIIGALVGTVAGVFTGLVGVLFLPLVGALYISVSSTSSTYKAHKLLKATRERLRFLSSCFQT